MKDEFSVNELEPERNTTNNTQEPTQSNVEENNNSNEYQGPTLKEVIANSMNPDYQGPTAKEIVVNSVKVDNTKKKNYVGLFVLILFLALVGIIATIEVLSEDKDKRNVDYLKNMPDWVEAYDKYFKEEYDGIVTYNVAFLDLDFDKKPEAIVNYLKDDKNVYEVIDAEDKQYVKVGEISDILMMYSFSDEDVTWYINTSVNDNDMNLIDLGKRLSKKNDYEVNLSLDNLSQFKSEHFTLSYEIKYTKISFRTVEKNLVEAVKVYDQEKDNVDKIIKNVIEEYSDNL